MNLYNEIDPKAAAWLRELIRAGAIPPGEVDTRSITDLSPHELTRYTQCHFFAGIGGWSHALALAGWPADRPVWTASCPCQPFSAAGKGHGAADPRHLWPAFFNLLRQCRPERVFGEQVASAIGHGWLDGICADLEAENYACGAVVLGAHSLGAPHQRQRLYWVADAALLQTDPANPPRFHPEFSSSGSPRPVVLPDRTGWNTGPSPTPTVGHRHPAVATGDDGPVVLPRQPGLERLPRHGDDGHQPGRIDAEPHRSVATASADGGMGVSQINRWKNRTPLHEEHDRKGPFDGCQFSRHTAWSDFDFLPCRDGKTRRIESGTFPLAHGVPGRVGLLRGYGNAIVPQVAAAFITTFDSLNVP